MEFDYKFEAERFLSERSWLPYSIHKHVEVFRKIDKLETEFARLIFKDKWSIEVLKWKTPRIEVYIDDKNTDYNCLEWLKEHKQTVIYNDTIIEPNIYFVHSLKDDAIIKTCNVFSFLNKNFAIEFKLIWG
jgi:hypothetical protein